MSYGVFVLPPPRLQPQVNAAIPQLPQYNETNNQLIQHAPSDLQIVTGEGTYNLRDDILLATPSPHPSESLVANSNPLVSTSNLPLSGTRLSLVTSAPDTLPTKLLHRTDTADSEKSGHSRNAGKFDGEENSSEDNISSTGAKEKTLNLESSPLPTFGDGNPALAVPASKDSKDVSKKAKPKNNLLKSNSTFISKVLLHELLGRRIQEHQEHDSYVIANVGRAVQWLDISSTLKFEYLTKLLFTKAQATCHDVNPFTKSATHLDVIMGFSTGDLIWYEPFSQKYTRVNKNGMIKDTPISEVRWLPNSENLFLTAHVDGTLMVFDKDKEDAIFLVEDYKLAEGNVTYNQIINSGLQIQKSVQSRIQRSNPVAVWRIGSQKINAFAFSPNGQKLAVVAEDGSLRILDYLNEKVTDVFTSYYGGMICVCWSPDGRYVVTGSQDDLVSVWSVEDRKLIARCPGHDSWVTYVAFDPWRCDDRTYRFGSVGEDCRLLLWDFNVGMVHRPRAASMRQRTSISSKTGASFMVDNPSNTRLGSSLSLAGDIDSEDVIFHPVQPRAQTAVLPPVMARSIDEHPLSWLGFNKESIITSCVGGHIRTWDRANETAYTDAT